MSDTRLSPGDTAPDFTLTSDTGEEVDAVRTCAAAR